MQDGIKNKKNMLEIKRLFCLMVYYGFATWLPNSYLPVIGKLSNAIRILCVRNIFKQCGRIRTLNRCVKFGNGKNVVIGDFSGIGADVDMPNDIIIGRYVMIGRQSHIFASNHEFGRTDIPIVEQGNQERRKTIIEDDVWIGLRVIMTPGRIIKRGMIVGAGSVLTKNFDEYSVVGGNPAKVIRIRK